MKLALRLDDVGNFRRILGFIVSVRKHCYFKFGQEELTILSLDSDGPLISSTLTKANFTRYDVVSKSDVIMLELNIEPFYQVLRNYEKTPSTSELVVKLQRKDENPNANGNDSTNKRRSVFLSLSYNEDITVSTEIVHSFTIPINLVRGQLVEHLVIPEITKLHLVVDIPHDLGLLFSRIERYKATDSLNIVLNKLGEIKVELQDEAKRMSIKWKGYLTTFSPDDVDSQATGVNKQDRDNGDLNMIKETIVKVRSKWWINASKLIELGDALQMYIHEGGCILDCKLEHDRSASIIYCIPGKLLE